MSVFTEGCLILIRCCIVTVMSHGMYALLMFHSIASVVIDNDIDLTAFNIIIVGLHFSLRTCKVKKVK